MPSLIEGNCLNLDIISVTGIHIELGRERVHKYILYDKTYSEIVLCFRAATATEPNEPTQTASNIDGRFVLFIFHFLHNFGAKLDKAFFVSYKHMFTWVCNCTARQCCLIRQNSAL